MSLDQERQLIEARFLAQWVTGSPSAARTAIGLPGHAFTPPTDASSVRLSILDGQGFNLSMGDPGANLVRYAGVVVIQIFTPGGVGTKAARDLADLIQPIFTNWRSGSLLFRTMNTGTADDTAPFYMLPVSFAFSRDETHG